MSVLNTGPVMRGPIRMARTICLAATLVATGALMLTAAPGTARADGIYVGGGGVGITIGSGGYRGYRGGFFFGGPIGFYGPPYRPYGAPYYYHPYDSRAYPYRSRVYVNPPRQHYRGQPQRVPYTKTGLAPFTPQWVVYCSRKFKSFDPNTGTYLAYSGKYRFCR
ncbi:BA14K family protein [Roseibium sp. Sym1]|uniref:BA14K family protein n=1 Tax=Roseibium sp. Sym1 TaxID=3016006 RepID=UPI0022B4B181|nr:BA14K family protein [Roseibium sp. Sym1]